MQKNVFTDFQAINLNKLTSTEKFKSENQKINLDRKCSFSSVQTADTSSTKQLAERERERERTRLNSLGFGKSWNPHTRFFETSIMRCNEGSATPVATKNQQRCDRRQDMRTIRDTTRNLAPMICHSVQSVIMWMFAAHMTQCDKAWARAQFILLAMFVGDACSLAGQKTKDCRNEVICVTTMENRGTS